LSAVQNGLSSLSDVTIGHKLSHKYSPSFACGLFAAPFASRCLSFASLDGHYVNKSGGWCTTAHLHWILSWIWRRHDGETGLLRFASLPDFSIANPNSGQTCDLIVAAETASSCFKPASTLQLIGLRAQVSIEPTCRCRLRYLRMPLGRSWLSM